MKTYSVFDEEFRPYGQVMEGYDFTELLDVLRKQPAPADSTIYVAGLKELEDCAVSEELEQRGFGGGRGGMRGGHHGFGGEQGGMTDDSQNAAPDAQTGATEKIDGEASAV